MNTFYIGVSGVARAGKDSFCNYLFDLIKNDGFNAKRLALAEPLKNDCKQFIHDKLGLNVWTDNSEEKAIFRELLVWYGKVKRQQTQGKYWTSLLEETAQQLKPEVCIISDIRYQQYEEDEVNWLKIKKKGILIHVERTDIEGKVVPPANMDETINDSIVKENADYKLSWPTVGAEDLYILDRYVKTVYNSVIREKLYAAKNS
jgi:hypothetical protein